MMEKRTIVIAVLIIVLCACAVIAAVLAVVRPWKESSEEKTDSDNVDMCSPKGGVSEDEVPSVDMEPVSQLRTLIGGHTTGVGACPVGTCRYDSRRHDKCPDDGYICPETEEREVDVGEYGNYTVNVVTACKCCKDNGITIRGKVVDAATGAPVANADLHVTLKSSATSDSDGSFNLIVSSDNTRVVINAERTGYVPAMKVVEITKGFRGPYDDVVGMIEIAEPVDIDATVDNQLAISGDPSDHSANRASIIIPARSFRTQRGMYSGIVKASVNYIDTANPEVKEEIPGRFVTDNEELLWSEGIFALSYQSDTGESLSMDPVIVRVPAGMSLWVLTSDGVWTPTGSEQRRRKRQSDSTDFEVAVENRRWLNIDQILKEPRCYFKGRIFDELTGTEITSSSTVSFKPFTLYTGQNRRFEFYHNSTSDPATTCYESRCPRINNPTSLITMKSYETISYGDISFPLITTLKPKHLVAYQANIELGLMNVQYDVLPNDEELSVNLTSNVNGPFYTDMTTCKSSTASQSSFHFLKPALPSYVPHPEDKDICTARIAFLDFKQENEEEVGDVPVLDFRYTLRQLESLPIITVVSTWAEGDKNYYYTDHATMKFSDIGGEFVYICIKYMCSTEEGNTTVRFEFDIPFFNDTSHPDGEVYEMPVFTCFENPYRDCYEWDNDVRVFEGSFEAAMDISPDGPDFYKDSPNDCAGRSKNESFAAMYFCCGTGYYD